ncbi:MAG: hypothetical protein AAF738_07410, partial [Bacteroidota bacterium]
LCKGVLDLQQKQYANSKTSLENALRLGLRNATDYALAHLNLAHIHYYQKNGAQARLELQKAKATKTKDLLIQQGIEQLEQALHF